MELHIETRDMLKSLGITTDLKGYTYLIDLIEIAKESIKNEGCFNGLCKNYGVVAKRYGATASRVERCIRYTIEVAMAEKTDKMRELFKNLREKPNNAQFISIIAEWLIIEEE